MDGPDADERNRERPGAREASTGSNGGPAAESTAESASDGLERGPPSDSRARAGTDDAVTATDDGLVRWLRESDDRTVTLVRDGVTIIAIVAIVGVALFGISGTWPPLVAVESGSMEPNIGQGDLVFIVDDGRFAGDGAVAGTGIVTHRSGRDGGYERFGKPGDVVVFVPNGDPTQTPTIHRAQFRVEKGERWVETKADPAYLNGVSCNDIASCPAPHDGFITKGDANPAYDQLPQSGANTTVVSPTWVTGKAMTRAPWLGELRLRIGAIHSLVGDGPLVVGGVGSAIALVWYATAAGTRGP